MKQSDLFRELAATGTLEAYKLIDTFIFTLAGNYTSETCTFLSPLTLKSLLSTSSGS